MEISIEAAGAQNKALSDLVYGQIILLFYKQIQGILQHKQIQGILQGESSSLSEVAWGFFHLPLQF